MKSSRTAGRAHSNPNHHLWNNNGTWFVHFTRYPTALTKERVRRSLGTKSLLEARQRRDETLRVEAGEVVAQATALAA